MDSIALSLPTSSPIPPQGGWSNFIPPTQSTSAQQLLSESWDMMEGGNAHADIPGDRESRALLKKYHPEIELPPPDMVPFPIFPQAFIRDIHDKLGIIKTRPRTIFDLGHLVCEPVDPMKEIVGLMRKKDRDAFDGHVEQWITQIESMSESDLAAVVTTGQRKRTASIAFGENDHHLQGPAKVAKDIISRYASSSNAFAAEVRSIYANPQKLTKLHGLCTEHCRNVNIPETDDEIADRHSRGIFHQSELQVLNGDSDPNDDFGFTYGDYDSDDDDSSVEDDTSSCGSASDSDDDDDAPPAQSLPVASNSSSFEGNKHATAVRPTQITHKLTIELLDRDCDIFLPPVANPCIGMPSYFYDVFADPFFTNHIYKKASKKTTSKNKVIRSKVSAKKISSKKVAKKSSKSTKSKFIKSTKAKINVLDTSTYTHLYPTPPVTELSKIVISTNPPFMAIDEEWSGDYMSPFNTEKDIRMPAMDFTMESLGNGRMIGYSGASNPVSA